MAIPKSGNEANRTHLLFDHISVSAHLLLAVVVTAVAFFLYFLPLPQVWKQMLYFDLPHQRHPLML